MNGQTETARQQRAAARRAWPGGVRRLTDEDGDGRVAGQPGALIGMVTALTLQAWAMRGEPLPRYTRADIPGRVLRKER